MFVIRVPYLFMKVYFVQFIDKNENLFYCVNLCPSRKLV
jgi:hypothetical protein